MFKKQQETGNKKIIFISYSCQEVVEKGYPKLKEYYHIVYEENGFVNKITANSMDCMFEIKEDLEYPIIQFVSNAFTGSVKNLKIYVPKNYNF